MADVATISLRVNTGELERGSQALDKFQQTAGGASKSADKLNDELEKTRQRADEFRQKMLSGEAATKKNADSQDALAMSFSEQIRAIKEATGANDKLMSISALLRRERNAGNIDNGNYLELISQISRRTRELTDIEQVASARREVFMKRLKDQVATQSLSRTELLKFQAAQLGVSSSASKYIELLDKAAISSHGLGLASAGARREIGILIGEVARGNFGALRGSSITLANRAGWIDQLLTLKGLGIATVVGGIAAAVYGLGKAWYEGSQESVEFNKQLILTGNYAGKTAGQLSLLSKSLSVGGITQSDMAASLAAVVGSGSFSSSSVVMVADTAAKLKDSIGQSIDETIKQFQRLQDDPVKAVTELDKSLHFLTATQLEQITSLSDQGKATDAAKIAMESYATAMRTRSESIKENLGSLEQAWKWLGNAASGAWDSMLNVGREVPVEVKVESVRKQLELAQKNLKSMQISSPVDTGTYGYGRQSDSLGAQRSRQSIDNQKALVSQLGKQLAELQEQSFQTAIKAGREKADQDEETRKKRQFQADQDLKRQYENAEEKHQRELLRIKNSDASDSTKKLAIQRENERYQQQQERKNRAPKEPAYRDDSATKILQESKQRLAALIEQYGVSQKMTEQEKRLVEFNQQVSDLKSKKILTADQQSIFHRADEIRRSLELEASESRRLENQKKLNELMDKANKFRRQQESKRDEVALLALGKTSLDAQRAAEIRRIQEEYAPNPAAQKQALADLKQTYAEMDALQENWRAGIKNGFSEYAREATNAYSQVSRITQNAFQGMSSSLADFLVTGKNSFNDFLTSTLKGITQMITQMALLNTMKGAFGGSAVGSFLGFANGGYVPAFDSGGYTGDGGKFEPKGIVHGGEFVFTKAATQALGVSNLYALMRGAHGYADGGVVGKAPMVGIPSLLPTGGGMVFNSTINVNGQTSQQTSAVSGDGGGQAIKNQIIGLVSQQIDQALGQSGKISKFVNNKIGRR